MSSMGNGQHRRQPKRRLWRICAVVVVAVCLATGLPGASSTRADERADESVTLFAASSMITAMEAAAAAFTAAHGVPVTTVFAASSRLARQIEAGAPAHIIVSANTLWMDYLVDRGRVVRGSRVTIAGNSLVLIAPAEPKVDGPLALDGASILHRLGDGRLAIGDPAHVPAGGYARAALGTLGLWAEMETRIAPMASVRAALAIVERGEAPLGIVYASDAAASQRVAVVATIPSNAHPPIVYPAALVAGGPTAAVDLLAFLAGPAGRAVLREHGFADPPDAGDH